MSDGKNSGAVRHDGSSGQNFRKGYQPWGGKPLNEGYQPSGEPKTGSGSNNPPDRKSVV